MRLRLLVLAVLALVAGGCSPAATVDVDGVAGGTAPPRDQAMAEVDWPDAAAWIARENAAGRPVVVKLFASWCAPCREEAEVVLAAVPDHPDVTFLGVDHEDRLDAGREFAAETGLLDGIPTLFDPFGEVARAGGATGMPSTLFFGADGELVDVHLGPLTPEELTERLEAFDAR